MPETGPLRLPTEAHATAFAEMARVLAEAGSNLSPDDMLLHAMQRYTHQARYVIGKRRATE